MFILSKLFYIALLMPVLIHGEESMAIDTALVLPITQQGDEVLRHVAKEVPIDQIVSPYIQGLIEKMKQTMRHEPGVGLAAPQVGVSLQIAVIEDVSDYHQGIPAAVLLERERVAVPYHVLINPKLTLLENEGTAEFFEGSKLLA